MSEQHVLLVGGSVETEAVLRTVLKSRGVGVRRARFGGPREQVRPTVVLVDEGTSNPLWPGVPRVVMGRATVDDQSVGSLFDYPDLISAIEHALDDAA